LSVGHRKKPIARRHEASAAAKEEQAQVLREMILGAGAASALSEATEDEVRCSERPRGRGR
jgi:hypothetical protein